MNSDLKKFIENNIGYLRSQDYIGLYYEAYEWLSDDQTEELTKLITKIFNIDAENIAKDCLMSKFMEELTNFVQYVDEGGRDGLNLASFVRIFMNQIMGVDFDEFQHMVELELEDNKDVIAQNDGLDLILYRRY